MSGKTQQYSALKVAESIQMMGTQNKDLIMDCLIIGLTLGRKQSKSAQINSTVNEVIQSIIYLNSLSESGLISPFKKKELYDLVLNDPTATFILLAQKEVAKSLGQSQPKIEQRQYSDESNLIIQQLLEEDKVQLKEMQEKALQAEEASQQVAKMIDQEEKNEQLLQQIKRDESQNKIQDCLICLEQIQYDELWPMTFCGHIFHRQCLNQTFSVKLKERDFPIKCPFPECKETVEYADLVETLDDNELELYNQYTFNQYVDSQAVDMSWCPTPNCSYAFVFEKGDNRLECPKCFKIYCLNCRVEFHNGQTCKEFQISNKFDQNDQLFIDFVQGKKFKQCPKCRFWVEKNEGCDHMTCRCKYQFCYVCGGVYGNCACKQNAIRVPPPNFLFQLGVQRMPGLQRIQDMTNPNPPGYFMNTVDQRNVLPNEERASLKQQSRLQQQQLFLPQQFQPQQFQPQQQQFHKQ